MKSLVDSQALLMVINSVCTAMCVRMLWIFMQSNFGEFFQSYDNHVSDVNVSKIAHTSPESEFGARYNNILS